MKPFTLLQVSDCHLLEDPDGLYRDQSPDQCFQRLLPALKAIRPDGIVVTGDVAEDGSAAAYERATELLSGLCATIAYLPGNHDDVDVMSKVFGQAGYQDGPILDWGGWSVVLLNSVIPDDPAGELAEDQWSILDQAQALKKPTVVFVHHPPMAVGSPWIDKYPLRSPERLMTALDPQWVKAVGFGHIHQPFSEYRDGIQYLSAPATSVNSQVGMEKFTVDPTGPKARWYRLWPEGRWATGVISAG